MIVLLGITMYWDKTTLCAAAGGFIALIVAWFLWDSWNIRPEPVDVAPKQIAIEAPKTLDRHAASSNLGAEAPKQIGVAALKNPDRRAVSSNRVVEAPKQVATEAPKT